MASNRIGRINEEIQRELSALIPGVKDPRVTGMISVTAVSTTPDLKYAKIYVSVLDKSSEAQVLKGLKSAGGWLRRELGRSLNLRNTPELSFVPDDSIDQGAHILSLLRDPRVDRLDHLRVPEQLQDVGSLDNGVVLDKGQLWGVAQLERPAQLPAQIAGGGPQPLEHLGAVPLVQYGDIDLGVPQIRGGLHRRY